MWEHLEPPSRGAGPGPITLRPAFFFCHPFYRTERAWPNAVNCILVQRRIFKNAQTRRRNAVKCRRPKLKYFETRLRARDTPAGTAAKPPRNRRGLCLLTEDLACRLSFPTRRLSMHRPAQRRNKISTCLHCSHVVVIHERSAAVFCAWQWRHSGCRLSAACVPPERRGTMWSTRSAAFRRPAAWQARHSGSAASTALRIFCQRES